MPPAPPPPPPSTDAVLVARIASGADSMAETALHILLDRYEDFCFRLAHHATGQHADAAEVVADTFFMLWQTARAGRLTIPPARESGLRPWLSRVVLNRAYGMHRQKSRRVKHEIAATDAKFACEKPALSDATDDARVIRIRQALDALPQNQREAFVLFVLEELPQDEIADVLGTTPGTVKTLVYRARTAIRTALDEK